MAAAFGVVDGLPGAGKVAHLREPLPEGLRPRRLIAPATEMAPNFATSAVNSPSVGSHSGPRFFPAAATVQAAFQSTS